MPEIVVMHDAYEAISLLEKLPLKIESITCHDDILLVGTKESHLLQYRIRRKSGAAGESKFDVQLERSNKNFAKKPITQLSAVPQLHILISLSDNIVSVHDLMTFNLITCINKTRGANLFALDVQTQKSLSGEENHVLRMCVSVKRKLQVSFWKNRNFQDLTEMNLYDIPRCMCWCKESICVGFRRDYFLVKINSGDIKELFPLGNTQHEPVITKVANDRLMLGRDNMSILIDSEGQPTQKNPINWSGIPTQIENNPPYIIGILPKFIEVRTIETKLLIQQKELHHAKFICQGSGNIYVASVNFIWRICPMPIAYQIRQLLENHEFELALRLAEMTDEQDEEKQKRVHNIKNLYAFDLFCQHRFEESMQIFVKLGTDPSHVIGLYPNLLPHEFRKQLEYPKKPPDLEGGELEKALSALQDYLTQKRNELLSDISKESNKELSTIAIQEGNTTIKSKKQLSQIIDTTLLKCYIQTNDALVAPLLRLKDNSCHVEESEKILKKKEKFSELIILYEKKGLHEKALHLLMKQAARPNSPLKGHDRTVQYLQHLGADHLKLIFDYAEWVLKEHPEDGLKIFTEDIPEVETLPRFKVLEYLEKISKDLAIAYLEHIIMECGDVTPEFHNMFAQSLREKVQVLMTEYLQSLPEGHLPSKAGQEPDKLGEYRRKLIEFLECSQYYMPERLLTRFPIDGFYEERAILLGRLDRHEQALGIYVHILRDDTLAKRYCLNYFDRGREGNKDVYYYLLKMYLQPPPSSSLGMSASQGIKPQQNMTAAFRLLQEHATKIDVSKTLELLPTSTPVAEILRYLEKVMEHQATIKRDCQVLKSMLYAENLQVHEQRMFYQKAKVVVNDEKICKICKKRLGNSAFVRYPNGVIVHYYCCKDPNKCPED